MTLPATSAACLHASTVALNGRAVLITGASGSGKSGLALDLISRGATLVADDRTWVERGPDGTLTARAPDAITGRIEARGIGILALPDHGPARVVLTVDLDHPSPARLPPRITVNIAGAQIDLINGAQTPNLGAVIHLILCGASLS